MCTEGDRTLGNRRTGADGKPDLSSQGTHDHGTVSKDANAPDPVFRSVHEYDMRVLLGMSASRAVPVGVFDPLPTFKVMRLPVQTTTDLETWSPMALGRASP